MKLLACVTSVFALLADIACANTEKVIFLAPPSQGIPDTLNKLVPLASGILTPIDPIVRTSLPVAFPAEQSKGLDAWYLLRSLNPGQRYEARICWAASQPTDFDLEAFTVDEILKNQDLLQAFIDRSSHQAEKLEATTSAESIVALRIQAAASFFTSNQTLMLNPPPVSVDIILDPYLANIFPKSLLPTAVYISGLAVVGFFVSGFAWSFLRSVGTSDKLHPD